MQRKLTAFVLLAFAAAACTPPGATTSPTKARRSPSAIRPVVSAALPTALASATAQLSGGGTLISDNGGNVIANNGGTLTGKVKAPASLIANNGGGLVSDHGAGLVSDHGAGLVANNGGGVIANNGPSRTSLSSGAFLRPGDRGRYRLSAVDQLAVAGAMVELLDAAGGRARDRQGNEVPPALTGPDGRYAFTADLPARNLVVRVVLAGKNGELRAIASPDAAARQATDIDLVSTLATGYILDKFVKGQADAQATLDKLPAAVEAETRRATAAALDKGVAPADLAPASVIAAVDALRKADGALDAQLEKVRALLVAAGLSDLGAGRLATEVGLPGIDDVAVTSDGRVFLSCARDRRVWTIDAAGLLRVAVGRSPAGADAVIDGKVGAEISIDRPVAIAPDGDGLLVLEPTRLSRLGADGVLKLVATGFVRAKAVVPRADGRHLVFGEPTFTRVKDAAGKYVQQQATPTTAWRSATGGAPAELVHTFPPDVGAKVGSAVRAVSAPGGAIWLALPPIYKQSPATVIALDATSFAPTDVLKRDAATQAQIAFDGAGRIFARATGKQMLQAVVGAGGFSTGEVTGSQDFMPLAQAPDGSWIFVRGGTAYRTTAAAPVLIAGLANPPREGQAAALSLGTLECLAVAPDGGMVFIDDATRWLWRADAAGNARVALDLPDGWPTEDDDYVWPESTYLAPDGAVWFFDFGGSTPRVLRLAEGGSLSAPFAIDDDETLEKLAVLADGTAAILILKAGNPDVRVLRLRQPDGQLPADVVVPEYGVEVDEEDEFGFAIGDSEFQLAAGPDGALWLAGDMTLRRWTAADGLTTVASGEEWESAIFNWDLTGLAVDRDGRIYGTNRGSVDQYDPKTKVYKTVAGRGLEGAAGAGVDEGTGLDLRAPGFDGAGNLYFIDTEYRQIKRVAREKL